MPEVQSFEPVGTNQMVDLFTGDFTYNIPLFELPGSEGIYPFNIAYHSGVSMDEEASWVGLGWNLFPGSINRDVRGIPDDFKGDEITKVVDMNNNTTFGLNVGASYELWGFDSGECPPGSSCGALGLGISLYHNSYKGIGLGISLGFDFDMGLGSKADAGLGLGLSMDTQNGAGLNSNISLSATHKSKETEMTLGAGINSQRGLDFMTSLKKDNLGSYGKDGIKYEGSIWGASSSISFADKSFSPVIDMETEGRSLNFSIKPGGDIFGWFPNTSIGGFYNWNYIKGRGEEQEIKTYGYLNLDEPFENGENENKDKYLLDFTRGEEYLITKKSPNLPAPNLTYDYYNVQGQGIGGVYRPFRSDIGHVHDASSESRFFGGSLGIEIGAGTPNNHFGVAGNYTKGKTTVGDWYPSGEGDVTYHDFYCFGSNNKGRILNDLDYEKYYFKSRGDFSVMDADEMAYIGNEDPMRMKIRKSGELEDFSSSTNITLNHNFIQPEGETLEIDKMDYYGNYHNNSRAERDRMIRNLSIQEYTHKDLGSDNYGYYQELLGEYNIAFYLPGDDYKVDPLTLGQSQRVSNYMTADHHVRGITAVNTNGMKYVYGIPAINRESTDYLFTIDKKEAGASNEDLFVVNEENILNSNNYKVKKTDKFFSSTKTPEYAYSYLLTSILGTDFVDADEIPGPSDGDYGYWIKFNYVRTNDEYHWRAPFKDAIYLSGKEYTAADDKGSFTFGMKELWTLATVETNTHIAVFEISKRKDGYGASSIWNHSGQSELLYEADSLYKLDKIKIYSKKDFRENPNAIPIKTIHFEYDYSLCPGVINNEETVGTNTAGKLTLRKIYYTYENDTRGQYNPYTFNYNEYNPAYNPNNYDRWGGYKSEEDHGYPNNKLFPYVTQFNRIANQTYSEKIHFQEDKDMEASSWLLTEVVLPSGGSIEVTYESDDYGYVQHKQAMQMFMVEGIETINENEIFNDQTEYEEEQTYKIFFKLENPVPVEGSSPEEIKTKYLDACKIDDENYQLYFNIRNNLKEEIYESIDGYCNIDVETGSYDYDPASTSNISIDGGTAVSCYTMGFIKVKSIDLEKKGGTHRYFHPFAAAAWQYMRTAAPDVLVRPEFRDREEDSNDIDRVASARSFLSIFNSMRLLFKDFVKTCYEKEWGDEIVLNKSFIRLGSPDFKKYGGGTRVKKIVVNDNWQNFGSNGSSSQYGTVYDYTTKHEITGEKISSGVATYEPMIGGSENPFRYAKQYPEHIPFRTPNQLFFEHPVNESYFPGPSVGYSKVTVRSLVTDEVLKGTVFATTPRTTGQTVNEFYTCKDFPVIVNETPIEKKPSDYLLIIPFIGQVTDFKLSASQGYSVILNDMHGKPKSVKNYGQDSEGNIIDNTTGIVSSQEYYYAKKDIIYDGKTVSIPDNENIKLLDDQYDIGSNNQVIVNDDVEDKKLIGVEYEFFTDLKSSRSTNNMWGLAGNVEMVTPIPFPIIIPSFQYNKKDLRTACTNKIIHKSGIMTGTRVSDGQSVITQTNEIFDLMTGKPVLTSVQNSFDEKVYTLETPAYYEYGNMGHAYKNWKLSFHARNILPIETTLGQQTNLYEMELCNDCNYNGINYTNIEDLLVPGDIVSINNEKVATYIGKRKDGLGNLIHVLYSDDDTGIAFVDLEPLPCTYPTLKVIQSGNKNMLDAVCGSLVTLDNDSDPNNSYFPYLNNDVASADSYEIDDETKPLLFSTSGFSAYYELIDGIKKYVRNHGDNKFTIGTGIYFILGCKGNQLTIQGTSGSFTVSTSAPVQWMNVNEINFFDLSGESGTNLVVTEKGKPTEINTIVANGTLPAGISTTITATASSSNYHGKKVISGESSKINLVTSNKVLDVKAVTYSDIFINERTLLSSGNDFIYNPYKTGERGVWRVVENYIINELKRKGPDFNESNYQNYNDENLELKESGIFYEKDKNDYLCLFDWQHLETGFKTFNSVDGLASGAKNQFKSPNCATRYNPKGYETESVNLLGIFSAALYGYSDNLATAVSTNAQFNETGFESFENFEDGSLIVRGETEGNIDVFHTDGALEKYDAFDVVIGVGSNVIINKKWNSADASSIVNSYIKASIIAGEFNTTDNSANTLKRTSDFSIFKVTSCGYALNGLTRLTISSPYDGCELPLLTQSSGTSTTFRPWHGKVAIKNNIPATGTSYTLSNFEIVDDVSHSGKKSMQLKGGQSVTFQQKFLKLIEGEKYIMNLWIKGSETDKPTWEGTGRTITMNNVSSQSVKYQTQLIEGWQLVQVEFVPNSGSVSVQLGSPAGESTYIDDIRILPADANMVTYVYNSINFRLMASLDNNHFASFYYYDSEGNLFLVKKETERGIKTIKESRSYFKETAIN
ncbi:MAG: hypothetical protein A2281_16490 [Bacteroidetes bacterium RIFOXYA12_FULL_38_20]|nr:MAG: hypothetical protein A2281_16490 [Bacteroidetes bacterium RIFOXYA12_FULL_38_20]